MWFKPPYNVLGSTNERFQIVRVMSVRLEIKYMELHLTFGNVRICFLKKRRNSNHGGLKSEPENDSVIRNTFEMEHNVIEE